MVPQNGKNIEPQWLKWTQGFLSISTSMQYVQKFWVGKIAQTLRKLEDQT